jgi:hypothetical protein
MGPTAPMYARLQQTAQSMLMNYGYTVTLVQMGPSSYDPSTGKNSPTSVSYTGQGAFMDFSMEAPSVTTIRGTEVQQGDKRLYLSMSATLNGQPVQMPQPRAGGDTVIDSNGVVYTIEASTTIDPTGQMPILHEAHVRGVSTQ